MTFATQAAARTIWQEARGETELGQRAVAHVIVNRMRDGRWGNNLASVCLWRSQFSGWNSHDPNFALATALPDNDGLLERFATFIDDAMSGAQDPTNGATFYYATSIPAPPWATGATFCGQIGRHRFYKDVK